MELISAPCVFDKHASTMCCDGDRAVNGVQWYALVPYLNESYT